MTTIRVHVGGDLGEAPKPDAAEQRRRFFGALGETVGGAILEWRARKNGMKKLPFQVAFHDEKPPFHLDDGARLYILGIDISSGAVVERYGGSGASTMIHGKDQLGEGAVDVPEGFALVFIEIYPDARASAWTVDVVSPSLVAQLAGICG